MSETFIKKEHFGTLEDGRAVSLYTISNAHGLVAKVSSYGATLTELHVPNRNNQIEDVVLGFDNFKAYRKGHPYFGTTTGRVANRIANGRFSLNGKSYSLAVNNPPNHLHGGLMGLDKRLWEAKVQSAEDVNGVCCSYLSEDNEEGYPGNLSIYVTYSLTHDNELRIEYKAETDQPTPVNLTNHSYFNLEDGGNAPITDHILEINADNFTPVDSHSIPTGEISPLADTVMDFRNPLTIGSRIAQLDGDPGGYDHNYVLNKEQPGKLEFAARVFEPNSGRVLEVFTTEPGIQFYTGNYLDGSLIGKRGHKYKKRHGFCLETQLFPDSVNQPTFPSIILNPGQIYSHTTIHKFSIRD